MGAHRYVVVEGVIGVGKTTLVHQLARRLSGRVVLEEFEENPFLPGFYRDRRAHALSTQLFFLMSRYRQQELLAQGDLFRRLTVADYFFDKDRIFALLTLGKEELGIYERLFSVLRPQVPRPDLVIVLNADLEVVLDRIARRGRSYEKNMDPVYMRDLTAAYGEFFAAYREAPVLTVDSTDLDFRQDSPELTELLRIVRAGETPRVLPAASRRWFE